ncbi:enoyl-CoA hydratase/isomerase family protein [Microbaculum sp. FT89]|uniref:enoyl-CoA hydratase/isomerase family protein n=1 Tax=Microbaculum sp. FT89 TaxID=3447298 RepID=UPI003F52A661
MSEVLYESTNGIARIVLNRSEKRNAVNEAMSIGLYEAWQRFERGDDRVALVTQAGADFSVGADIKQRPQNFPLAIPGIGLKITKPIVAAVDGWCTGGMVVLVQMCDLCIATDRARFLYPEAKRGFTGGMIAGIANRMPHKVAMEMMLLGDELTAQRAYEVGFVNRLTAPDDLDAVATDYARRLAQRAPLVVAKLKEMAAEQVPLGPAERGAQLRYALQAIRQSPDADEGIASFLEKRPANFTGKLTD